MKTYATFCLLLALAGTSSAQISMDSVRKIDPNLKVSFDFLIGTWESADSLKNTLQFVANGAYEVIIEPKTLIHPYAFKRDNDSVSTRGMAMNWPPGDCIIRKIDENSIELLYFDVFSEFPYQKMFTRAKKTF